MNSTSVLVEQLASEGIELWLEDGQLRFRAPTGVMTPERLAQLRQRKSELTAWLDSGSVAAEEPPLLARGSGGLHPLTFSQAVFARQYAAITALRSQHVGFALRVSNALELGALRAAVAGLLARQTILRARYVEQGGSLCVRIDDSLDTDIRTADLSELASSQRDERVRELLAGLLHERFDLERGPLVRILGIELSAHESLIGFVTHHSVADAWSVRVLASDLAELYLAACERRRAGLPELPIQFTDYAHWLRAWRASPAGDRHLRHWIGVLSGLARPYWLPRDDSAGVDGVVAPITASLSHETREQLQAYARSEHTTLFSLVLAAFITVLARWSNESSVLVSVAHSGRLRPELHHVAGCFLQKWVLRVDLNGSCAFTEVLSRFKESYAEALPFLQMPYSELRPYLAQPGNGEPLLDITVNYIPELDALPGQSICATSENYAIRMDNRYWGADEARLEQAASGSRLVAKFIEEPNAGLGWSLRFPQGVFAQSTVERASAALRHILEDQAAVGARLLRQEAAGRVVNS